MDSSPNWRRRIESFKPARAGEQSEAISKNIDRLFTEAHPAQGRTAQSTVSPRQPGWFKSWNQRLPKNSWTNAGFALHKRLCNAWLGVPER